MTYDQTKLKLPDIDPSLVELRRSGRTRRLSITVLPTGLVRVSCPPRTSDRTLLSFLQQHADWIERQVAEAIKNTAGKTLLPGGKRDYLKQKEATRRLVTSRLVELDRSYGFGYGRVSIKNLRASWGSCSELGNLNFNYRIVYLPDKLARYVVAHELCHRGELNHSKDFWGLVARTVPDHRACRREIRKYLI